MHKFFGKYIFFWCRDMPKKADIPHGREKPFDQNNLNGIFVLSYRTNFNNIFHISHDFIDFIHIIAHYKNNLKKRSI